MYDEAKQKPNYDKEIQNVIGQIFKTKGREQIAIINNKLNIVMDNSFARAIAKQAQSSFNKYVSDFKKLEDMINFLTFLTEIASEVKFIQKREKMKVDKALNHIKESLEYKLNRRINALLKSDDKEEFRADFFYILNFPTINVEDDEEISKFYQKFYRESMKNLDRKLFIKIDSII